MTAWADLDPELRRVAEEVCTARELDALKLWSQGWGYRKIGLHLGYAPSTIKDRIKRALQKMAHRKEELEHLRRERNAA